MLQVDTKTLEAAAARIAEQKEVGAAGGGVTVDAMAPGGVPIPQMLTSPAALVSEQTRAAVQASIDAGSPLFDVDKLSYDQIVDLVDKHPDEVKKMSRAQYEKLQNIIYKHHYCTIPGVPKQFAVMSISDVGEQYKMRVIMTSMVMFLYRMREEYKASSADKQTILNFLNFHFKFDPNRHLREARDPIDTDPKDGDAERKEIPHSKYIAADIPANAFHNWESFHTNQYEKIRSLTNDLYAYKPDVSYAINILRTFDEEKDAQEFARLHASKFASLYLLETNKWAMLGPYRENLQRVQYYGAHGGIINSMLEGVKKTSDIGGEIIKHRVTKAKRQTILESGPDDKKLEEYSTFRSAFPRELTREQLKKLEEEYTLMKGGTSSEASATSSSASSATSAPSSSASASATSSASSATSATSSSASASSSSSSASASSAPKRGPIDPNPPPHEGQMSTADFREVMLDGQKILLSDFQTDEKGKIVDQPPDTIAVPVIRMNADGSVQKAVFFAEPNAPSSDQAVIMERH